MGRLTLQLGTIGFVALVPAADSPAVWIIAVALVGLNVWTQKRLISGHLRSLRELVADQKRQTRALARLCEILAKRPCLRNDPTMRSVAQLTQEIPDGAGHPASGRR